MMIFLDNLRKLQDNIENFKKNWNFSNFKDVLIVQNCIFFCSPEVWTENFFQSSYSLFQNFWENIQKLLKPKEFYLDN